MPQLVPVTTNAQILPRYRGTAIEALLCYHNLGAALERPSSQPEILIGMCMDHRKDLVLPNEFAYVLRAAGGNLRDSAFEIEYAIAVGGVTTIALLAHNDCGMAYVTRKRDAFITGMVDRAGWTADAAAAQFASAAPRYEIGDPVAFAVAEARRLRATYPKLLVAPLLYDVRDDRLVQIADPA